MTDCELCELELSAALDGVVDAEALVPALDHLVRCESCRGFWHGARVVEAAAARGHVSPPPERIWDRIEETAQGTILPFSARPVVRWSLRAAAVVAVGVGLWAVGALRVPQLPLVGDSVEVTLEGNRGEMSEERFVRLTAELLRADRRYHRKMIQVLSVVNRETLVREGAPDEPQPALRASIFADAAEGSGADGSDGPPQPPDTIYW